MHFSALDLTAGKKIDGYSTLFSGGGRLIVVKVLTLTED